MTSEPGLKADLRAALALWPGDPVVPLLYLLIGAVYALEADYGDSEGVAPLTFLALLLHIGMCGTSRLWYARRMTGEGMTVREALHFARRFFWRFVGLGFLFVLLLLAISVPLSLALDGVVPKDLLGVAAPLVALAVAGTVFAFGPTMLALAHPTSWTAVSRGRDLALRTGARSYTVVPALVLAGTSLASQGPRATAAVALVALPMSLMFAGASTLFFLRHQDPAGPEGSLAPRRASYRELARQV